MGLSNDLISQFVKITKDEPETKNETIVYGTIVNRNDAHYVIIDGSKTETPIITTSDVGDGERVIVMLKNHTATVIGNISSPSGSKTNVDSASSKAEEAAKAASDTSKKVDEFEQVIMTKVSAEELAVEQGRITKLESDNVTIRDNLNANTADIGTLTADLGEFETLTTERLDAIEGSLEDLEVEKLDAKYATIENLQSTNQEVDNLKSSQATFSQATAERFTAVEGDIEDLTTNKLDAESAKVTYANIDFSNIGEAAIEEFLSKSGIIDDLVVSEGTVTGKLVGVTISGDLIEGNTVKAEKLVVKGSDGLYYKLNIEAGATTSSEVTETDLQNGLHGTAIIAKTITAEKISVDDLVAFDATIAGLNITNGTLYSGAKSSVDNTAIGMYFDKHGQVAIGDASKYIKYYTDANGSRRLEIIADSLIFGTSKKSVETVVDDIQTSVDNIEIGAENLYVKSASFDSDKWINTAAWTKDGTDSNGNARIKQGTWAGLYQFIKVKAGDVYTLSANVFGDGAADLRFYASLYSEASIDSTGLSGVSPAYSDRAFAPLEEQRFYQTYTITEDGYLRVRIENGLSNSYIWVSSMKLERGNKSTDWSPAPSDMATSEEVDRVQNAADNANDKASNAETLIAQLSDSISMLVTDGNGTSLMTQTEDGWTFSTSDIQSSVNSISEALNSLTTEVGDVDNTVNIIQQAVNDLGIIAEYIKIGTYEDEPCIELGEGDSDFKLRITNTRMIFTEGSEILAYFNNRSLHIKKAVVEEEFQQGGFVWKIRSNGNLALVWKGVDE